MALSILNNISALSALNQLSVTRAGLQKTLQQLSSGSRINSGADDAAGLSISNGLQANIAALTQSAQNAADGIGLLQTGDGALSQVTAMLNRAITLATEASNSVIDPTQATALNAEFQSILTEINNVGSATTFNGQQVFTGNDVTPFLSDGTAGNSLLSGANMSVGALTTDALGLGDLSTPAASATNTLTLTANVADGGTVQINSQTYTFRTTASSNGEVQIGADAKTTLSNLAAAIAGNTLNTANSDVTASVSGAGNNASITLTAKTSGADGNLISTDSSLTAAAGTAATGTWSNGGRLGDGTNGSYAQSQLSLSGNVVDGDSLLIGSTVYTFRTTASVAGDVRIGADAGASLSNLAQAIGGDSLNSANGSISALASGTNITFTAKTAGTGGNSLVASGMLAGAQSITPDGSFTTSGSTGFMGGAMDATAANGWLNLYSQPANGETMSLGGQTYTFENSAAGAYQVQIGSSTQDTLNNLSQMIDGQVAGTSANANVTAGSATHWSGPTHIATVQIVATTTGVASNNVANLSAQSELQWNFAFGGGADGTNATASLDLSNNAAAGESVNIGHTTYVFTSGASSGNYVHLGATQADTATNLANAINGNSSDTSVSATANGSTVNLTATSVGTAGNRLAASGTLATPAGTWSSNAGELTGGTASTTATMNYGIPLTSGLAGNGVVGNSLTLGSITYTFVNAITGDNQVLIVSGDGAATAQNLIDAINGNLADKGTAYSANLSANSLATASYAGASGGLDRILFTATSPGAWANGQPFGTGGPNWANVNFGFCYAGTRHFGTNAAAASNTLTLTQNLAAGSTITLGSVTYTFQSGAPTAAGQVQIGSSINATLQNLKAAVNGNGLNSANSDVTASASGSQITFTAINAGTAGNSLAAYGSLLAQPAAPTVSSWTTSGSAGYLGGGGAGASSATESLSLTSNLTDGSTVNINGQTYKFTSGTVGSGQVAIGANAYATLQNLASAIAGDTNNTANTAVTTLLSGSGNNAQIAFTSTASGTAGNGVAVTGNLLTFTPGGGANGIWSNYGSLAGGVDGSSGAASLDLNATDHAQAALLAVNNAISKVAQQRGNLGAYINQLQAATNVMNTQSQNLSSAESTITDADMAQTVANLTKYNILQSTGIAALRQSYQVQQMLLKLLQ